MLLVSAACLPAIALAEAGRSASTFGLWSASTFGLWSASTFDFRLSSP